MTTTLEKLFLQIFERKASILEQVQQQADAYTQQLASRLLLDGITPPPSLLNPGSSLNPNDQELRTDENLASVGQKVTSVLENCDTSNLCGGKEKATSIVERSPVKVGSMKLTIQENSYDISPYQCSDDEDEEEDDMPTKKFIPSWASKHRVAMVLPLQQKLDPETIFSVESFCSMDEVLLPRRLHAK